MGGEGMGGRKEVKGKGRMDLLQGLRGRIDVPEYDHTTRELMQSMATKDVLSHRRANFPSDFLKIGRSSAMDTLPHDNITAVFIRFTGSCFCILQACSLIKCTAGKTR